MWFILLGRSEPERVSTGVVSANFFALLGVKPMLGRSFTHDDEQAGSPAVLMLSHKYWQRSFGGDPSIVGRVFQMNDRPHEVIGVLPAVPQYPGGSGRLHADFGMSVPFVEADGRGPAVCGWWTRSAKSAKA